MKFTILLSVYFCAAICFADELVKNGNFEKGIAPWRSAQRSGGKKDLHTLSPDTKYGTACLKATGDPGNKYNSFI